jgi:hypothetical protein
MLPRWKRISYSFVSVLFGGTVVGIGASLRDNFANPKAHVDPVSLLISTCIVAIASLSGWLVALPIVLLVRDYSRWRIWLWGAVGICIGPGVVIGMASYGFITERNSADFFTAIAGFLLLATLVSALSTCTYLFLSLRTKNSLDEQRL